MFNKKSNYKAQLKEAQLIKLEEAIKLFNESEYGSEEYYKHLSQINILKKDLENQKSKLEKLGKGLNSPLTVSLLTTAGGILATAMILNYEKADIVTSKAASLAFKLLGR